MSPHSLRQGAPGPGAPDACSCELEALAKLKILAEKQVSLRGHDLPDCRSLLDCPTAPDCHILPDYNIIYLLGRHRPELGENVYLHHSSQVIGDVHLGSGSNVWCNAVVRGDNGAIHIGEGSNIQDNAVIHSTPGHGVLIGRGVSIGHGAIIHGCVIGDNCLIGNNATVMDGAIIQENTLIGASTVVCGHRTYDPGVLLMGNPGRVRRPLTDAEVKDLRINAARYVEQAARYRQDLRKLIKWR